jgi:hypothetical protein
MRSPVGFAWGAALAISVGSVCAALVLKKQRNPREIERRRRERVNAEGRFIEGYITYCEDGFIEYSYQWRGVRYEAAQDISELLANSSDLCGFTGPATIKFLGSRPADSIVLADNWSGIHRNPTQEW